MKLFFKRHGEAESLLGPDEGSSLTAEGTRQVQRLAAKLKEGVCFDLLWSSPLKRAVETATILVESGAAQKPEVSDLLLPSTEPAVLTAFLTQLPELPPVRGLVGHDPLLSENDRDVGLWHSSGGSCPQKAGVGVLERESGSFLVAFVSQTWLEETSLSQSW